MGEYIIGCDIGGTFTDFVVFDAQSGQIIEDKCLTTPADPSQGVMTGIRRLKARLRGLERTTTMVVHATTLTSNAVLERKGAPTALLCTRGFPHVLAARRHQRVSTYELFVDPPPPLVPQDLVFEITERTYSDGRILVPLAADEVRALARRMRDSGRVESVAISFLHSFVNARNEQETARLILEEWPGTTVSLSSHVLPEMREYERTSTTVINAYVKPMVRHYLGRLQEHLAGEAIEAPLYIMVSNGGLASVGTACDLPVRMTESGPVAGAIIGRAYAQTAGLREIVTFDMGGTTAKACLVRDGILPLTSELEVARSARFVAGSGLPIATPSVDLIEIGAGGGSIARVDSLGLVQVGPDSAGAAPGPMCYGRGGQEPTVTDADLVLGYLAPDYFLGGEMKLDVALARQGLEQLGRRLGRDFLQMAWTVHDVVNEGMATAIRMHVVERGGDPTRAPPVALGGAGPVHAYNLAAKLGVSQVLVPLRAGVLSALGLLITPPAFDLGHSYRIPFSRLDFVAMEQMFQSMESEVFRLLRAVDPNGPLTFTRAVECKYIGQGYAVTVGLPEKPVAKVTTQELWKLFAQVYRGKYGYFYEDVPAEVVNLRLHGTAPGHTVQLKAIVGGGKTADKALKGERAAYSAHRQQLVTHKVYDRYLLGPGARLPGPAIIEEKESTTVVDVGGEVEVDPYGSLLISVA